MGHFFGTLCILLIQTDSSEYKFPFPSFDLTLGDFWPGPWTWACQFSKKGKVKNSQWDGTAWVFEHDLDLSLTIGIKIEELWHKVI